MKYVIGMLMLAMLNTQAAAADDQKAEAKAERTKNENRQPAASEKQQVDELEKVLQSTYEYNNTMMELGDSSGR